MRYDAAIIGAGAEGLAAATLLAKAGLRIIVVERGSRVGGRCVPREFHPGFRATPFADTAAEIPPELYWSLELARRGAIAAPPGFSTALWPDRRHILPLGAHTEPLAAIGRLRREIAQRVLADACAVEDKRLFGKRRRPGWPGSEQANLALSDVAAAADGDAAAHLVALALSGRTADPFLPGTALHLLAAGSRFAIAGGLGRLATALADAAKAAGVAFSFGLEATDIHRRDGRIVSLGLADNSQIATRAVVSTLDIKRTFLNFFPWKTLPKPLVARVNAFRMAGATARVLFACTRLDDIVPPGSGPFHIAPSLERMSAAFYAWRNKTYPEHAPITLQVGSRGEPGVAPPNHDTVTATIGAVPREFFDGAWTHEKRETLRRRTLETIEAVLPGFSASVIASEVVAPPDIEDALGATDGDLVGGEIVSDQMLGSGLWTAPPLPRTPISGLYLAGSNVTASAFTTCAAGAAAAYALLADRGQVR